jgi:hypothetical protein
VQRRLLLDVVVRQGAAILQLLARKNQTLLIGRNTLLILDLLLDVLNGVRSLSLECDCLSSESLDKDLHMLWLHIRKFPLTFLFWKIEWLDIRRWYIGHKFNGSFL